LSVAVGTKHHSEEIAVSLDGSCCCSSPAACLFDSKQPSVRLVASNQARSNSPGRGKVPAKMPRRILIADDSSVTRKTLLELLHTHGWQVCGQAENGLEAVRMAAELKPDVVILDLAMPSMDGLTAAREISQAHPTIPIVMHTFHDLPQLELEAKKNGVRRIVPKSKIAHLVSVLDELTCHHGFTGSPQSLIEEESATRQPTHVPSTQGAIPDIQAAKSASQSDSPDDVVKAS